MALAMTRGQRSAQTGECGIKHGLVEIKALSHSLHYSIDFLTLTRNSTVQDIITFNHLESYCLPMQLFGYVTSYSEPFYCITVGISASWEPVYYVTLCSE